MKLLSVLLSVAGAWGLVLVSPVGAEVQGSRGAEEAEEAGGEMLWQLGNASDLIAQGVTRVTGVEVVQTAEGLELVLETVAGSERLVPLILPEGNDLVIDILDATLAFAIRNGVSELNPAPGISRVTVNRGDENSIRVRIAGDNQTPSAEVVTGRDELVLSVTPESTTAEQEPDESIEVIATGEAEDDDDYFVTDATTATKTDIAIQDTPGSIQVIPEQVIEDRQIVRFSELADNISGVTSRSGYGGLSSQDYYFRGFSLDSESFRNGFRDFGFISPREIANVERVEFLKGPASVLYGGGSGFSGLVNAVTKKPVTDAFVSEDEDLPEDDRLQGVPENSASLWTTYELQQGSLQGLGFGFGLYFVGDREIQLPNTIQLDSYVRADAALFYRRNNYELALNFKNITDTEYYSTQGFYITPEAPFTVLGNVSVTF